MSPVVTVVITTYNHERFIERALQSVLDQQGTFEVEILVGEDCSTDGTRAVLERLLAAHPERFSICDHGANVGGHENFSRLWKKARGEFIAWLEGDDFWIDPCKLQKQIDLMRAAPNAAIGFTRCQIVSGSDALFVSESRLLPRTSQFHHLATGNYIHTPTVIYRRGIVEIYPEWVKSLPLGDWPLHLLHARAGSIVYLDDATAAYRVHLGGSWSSRGRAEQVSETRVVIKSFLAHVKLTRLQRLALRATDARLHAEFIKETSSNRSWKLQMLPSLILGSVHFLLRGALLLPTLRSYTRKLS